MNLGCFDIHRSFFSHEVLHFTQNDKLKWYIAIRLHPKISTFAPHNINKERPDS